MQIKNVHSADFAPYGKVLTGYSMQSLQQAMEALALPEGTAYEPSIAALEQLPLAAELRDRFFGGLPTQLGACYGHNQLLNAVEYHRSSEVNYAAEDLILLLGHEQDIVPETNTYETKCMEAFLVPAGTLVEVYATTLHFAPCGIDGAGFRCLVALPKGTNEPLPFAVKSAGEDKLLFAQNKWLIAHKDSGLQQEGAFIGLVGENLRV